MIIANFSAPIDVIVVDYKPDAFGSVIVRYSMLYFTHADAMVAKSWIESIQDWTSLAWNNGMIIDHATQPVLQSVHVLTPNPPLSQEPFTTPTDGMATPRSISRGPFL